MIKFVLLVPCELICLILIKCRSVNIHTMKQLKRFVFLALVGWYYYVIAAFFSRKNNCKKEATLLWVGHLFVVSEAIVHIGVYVLAIIVCCLLYCYFSCLYWKKGVRKPDGLKIKKLLLNAASLKLRIQDMRSDDL